MSKVIKRTWTGEGSVGIPRRDRMSCRYSSYVPDPLAGRTFKFDGEVAADVADAEKAIALLDANASHLADTEALARLLLRAEAVASSKIEGLEVGPRRLLKAEVSRELGQAPLDVTADEVLGNVDAMVAALDVAHAARITAQDLLDIHRRLLEGSRLAEHGGKLRDVQNWIGGSAYNPCSAEFVPPPPEFVGSLLEDLAEFCNTDSLPAVTQAAVAHAQLETIHPFADGNGRTGRALIHLILRRRGLAPRILTPVSLVLATWAKDYVEGLNACRYVGSADSAVAHDGLNRWVGLFATACRRAVEDAESFEERARAIEAVWRERLGPVRAASSVEALLKALPGVPIITVKTAARLIGRSTQAANEAVGRLVDARILKQLNLGRRNRAFEAPEVIDAFTDLERRLGSPLGDTRSSLPSRPVPARRR
jgi:Fic family protein